MESSKTPDADGVFSKAPIFNFNDDKLKFDTNDVSNANDNYGSASAFVPKYPIYTKGIPNKDTFCFYRSTERIHPPSILPISSVIF